MSSVFGSIFLGGTGLIFGLMLGKSVVRSGQESSEGGVIITFAGGVFFMCGALWIGLLNHWI